VAITSWERTPCRDRPLDLAATLSSGQAFRWRRDAAGAWWGTVEDSAIALWQAHGDPHAPLFWQTFPETGRRKLVERYLALDVDLPALYALWLRSEPRIGPALSAFRGLRILRQPPVECFFAFQCATCNTVVKITRSVRLLAERYGAELGVGIATRPRGPEEDRDEPPPLVSAGAGSGGLNAELAARHHAGIGGVIDDARAGVQYAFPSLDALARADEALLRADLWGYRAPRVLGLAQALLERGPSWLESLRAAPYAEMKAQLCALHGIGEKVADCICLFCLDMHDAVPVDTHVRQIACELFVPDLRDRSLTPRVYAEIAAAYRDRFGPYAGWAQQYLFHERATRRQRRGSSPGARWAL